MCFLIGARDEVLWSDASESPVALPDSRARWEAIWARRDELVEIAHTHPVGPHAFSSEDRSTMEALIAALGRAPRFSVVSTAGVRVRDAEGNEFDLVDEPGWVARIRAESGMEGEHA